MSNSPAPPSLAEIVPTHQRLDALQRAARQQIHLNTHAHEILHAARIRQRDFARAVRVHETRMSKLLRGTQALGQSLLRRLACALGVQEHLLRREITNNAAARANLMCIDLENLAAQIQADLADERGIGRRCC
jgi:hypothetical protein